MTILFFGTRLQFERYKESIRNHCLLSNYIIKFDSRDYFEYEAVKIHNIDPRSDPENRLRGMRADRLVIEEAPSKEWHHELNMCLHASRF